MNEREQHGGSRDGGGGEGGQEDGEDPRIGRGTVLASWVE
jgi:hypothetical protein